MSEKPEKNERRKKARVLVDCAHGRVNQVVELTAAELESARAGGLVDDHADAVKYAESLNQK